MKRARSAWIERQLHEARAALEVDQPVRRASQVCLANAAIGSAPGRRVEIMHSVGERPKRGQTFFVAAQADRTIGLRTKNHVFLPGSRG